MIQIVHSNASYLDNHIVFVVRVGGILDVICLAVKFGILAFVSLEERDQTDDVFRDLSRLTHQHACHHDKTQLYLVILLALV